MAHMRTGIALAACPLQFSPARGLLLKHSAQTTTSGSISFPFDARRLRRKSSLPDVKSKPTRLKLAVSYAMSPPNYQAPPLDDKQCHGDDEAIPLLTPYELGPFSLSMRMVYAPLTRCRAVGSVPIPQAVTYYCQRAHEGALIISEGTVVSPDGYGNVNVPGIHRQEQLEGWTPIATAVKDKGAVFFMQLWHVGRRSHPDFMPDKVSLPVAPSPIPLSDNITIMTPRGPRTPAVPREMTSADIARVVDAFRQGARNARLAGFDGVEIHGANGYLLDQFLKDGPNQRTDEYGGSVENRARFALEVVDACVEELGRERVGLRLSPFGGFLEVTDSDPYATNLYLVERLNERGGLAYLHFVEPRVGGSLEVECPEGATLEPFRKAWKGTFIAAGGYTRESGNEAVESGHADLVAYGRLWLANPDLPLRFKLQAPLNAYNRKTFYISDPEKGYTDYPFLEHDDRNGFQIASS